MVSRADLLMLGITSGVSGGLIGGTIFGYGVAAATGGFGVGYLLMMVAAPLSAGVGWFFARRLARQL